MITLRELVKRHRAASGENVRRREATANEWSIPEQSPFVKSDSGEVW